MIANLLRIGIFAAKKIVELSEENAKKERKRDLAMWVCSQCGTKTEGNGVCCKKCGSRSMTSVATLKERESQQALEDARRRAAQRELAEASRREREQRSLARIRWNELRTALTCPKCRKMYDKTYAYCPSCVCQTRPLSAATIFASMRAEFPDLIATVDNLTSL